jgi:hypothetical protein
MPTIDKQSRKFAECIKPCTQNKRMKTLRAFGILQVSKDFKARLLNRLHDLD